MWPSACPTTQNIWDTSGLQENTMTQCDTAVLLPQMTSCTRWVQTSSLSPFGSFLFSAADRKRRNNRGDDKDILKESTPYRI